MKEKLKPKFKTVNNSGFLQVLQKVSMRNHPTGYKKELGVGYRRISRMCKFLKREAEGHDVLSILVQRSQT